MTPLLEDLRYGIRLLRRAPGFSIAAVLALALGIGANTAIFSVVDAVLIAPLPFGDPDRLVMVWEDASFAGFPRNTPAPANWVDWRKQNTVFTDIAASRGWTYNLTGDGSPEQLPARRTTASFWTVLDAKPLLGRVFTEEEDQKGAAVAVIGYGLWQRRFGGDAEVLGRKILLNGAPYTVIGVMPKQFTVGARIFELWTPASFTPEELARRGSHFLQCIGRLKPGVTLAQAQTEMSGIMKRLAQQYSENQKYGVVLVPMAEQVAGNVRPLLLVLLGAAGCVLLIACANIANLLLVRGTERQREMAVRAAIGAGSGRLVRQLLTESLLLAGCGALAGLGIAYGAMGLIEKLVPPTMSAVNLTLDGRLLGLTMGLAILTGLLFGAAPAIGGTRLDLHSALKQGGRGMAGRSRGFLRNGLVVTQVALALVLLTGAGLMLQTLYNMRRIDIGMRTDHILTVVTQPSPARYPNHEKQFALVNAVLEKVRAMPGVLSAGYTSNMPLTTGGNTNGYVLRAQQRPSREQAQDALFRVVSTDFLSVIGARLREGRFFTDADRAGAPGVLIINETFANMHWPGESALGKSVQINRRGPNEPWLAVVGVVKEIRERGIEATLKPAMYMPHAQSAGEWPIPSELALRTATDPESLASAVRQAVWSVDKDQPISRVRTMEAIADLELQNRSQSMVLLGAFAGLALVLASIGIYGVLAFVVTQRSREIAVRMAMGARPLEVLLLVAGRGLGLTALGLAIGCGASVAVSRLIQKLMFGVSERDPRTLAAVCTVLLLVSLAACAIPARRASRIDPASALRND